MLNCKQMAELSTAYLEGELGFWQRMNYYLHYLLCPPCRHYRDQIEKTRTTLRQVKRRQDAGQEAPEVPAELLRTLRDPGP